MAPGSLVEQWQDEMGEKFGLKFDLFGRDLVEASRSGNPFDERDLLIARVDQLARKDDLLAKLALTQWDLVIVDEAHKLSANYFGNKVNKTRRFELGEQLGRIGRHFLLMTATPHNGKEADFQLWMSLLDGDRFHGKARDGVHTTDVNDLMRRMRRALRPIFPDIYSTLTVPKTEELVATPYRHGGKPAAEKFFLEGMGHAISGLGARSHPAYPITIYYAFKQAESSADEGTHSTGWETFLQGLLQAGLAINATWPMRTEGDNRQVGVGNNALASSIVLACRPRASNEVASRREFIRELVAKLPEALDEMTRGGVNSPVAPVDLSQAIIGPGMAIFSRYAAVLEADGKPMSVRTALQLINRFLAEDDFDHDTQFCLHWFEAQGWAEGRYGEADVLARAKGTSVGGVAAGGVIDSGAGKVRLLRPAEYSPDWQPARDQRTPVWEAVHHLIRALRAQGSSATGALLAQMPDKTEPVRALAYRLYTLCERRGWAEDARAYNELITSWDGIEAGARQAGLAQTQVPLEL